MTEHTAGVTPDTAQRQEVPEAGWGWVVAVTPLVALGLAAVFAGSKASQGAAVGLAVLAAVVIAVIAATADSRLLRKGGEPIPLGFPSLILIAPWAYLIGRARRLTRGQQAGWVLAWTGLAAELIAGAAIFPVAGALSAGSGPVLDQVRLQSVIAHDIKTQSGVTVTVACPSDPPVNPGHTFQCVATASDKSVVIIDVTVQDTAGDIVWAARH